MTDWWSFGQGVGVGIAGTAMSVWGLLETRARNRKADQDEDRSAVAEASMVHFKTNGSATGSYMVTIINGSPRELLWPELVDFKRPEPQPGDSWALNPFMGSRLPPRRQHLPRGESFKVSVVLKAADDLLIERRYGRVTCTIRWCDASGQWWQRTGTHDPLRIDKPQS
ncbi:hypothetical protein K378_01426 [Streptomyces sp. Amel2xB2]|uniref:hypothetical protein n=1 Tax=Streptomyces sp. Amel2xB2 TaxID=1305829 RepID=UPI000DB9803F|nr:hypothetical protein [Streptomyces sp. Amel2xB2]RAJ70261.1 hypothetical protein K378_01426 [Streptomyces sp. Amel2xB2]